MTGLASRGIPRRSADAGPAPLSAAQERFWLFERFWPGTAVYHRPVVVRLRGALHRSALARALADVVDRHEALRTAFRERDGVPMQIVLPRDAGPLLEGRDLAGGAERPSSALLSAIREEIRRPFELGEHPVFALQPPGLDGGSPPASDPPALAAGYVAAIRAVRLPANHLAMLEPPHVAHVAAVLDRAIESGAVPAAGPGSS